jgi:hypothetical protein
VICFKNVKKPLQEAEEYRVGIMNVLYMTEKIKGKARPRTGHEGPEWEQRCRSTLSLTSALDGVGG